MLARFQRFDHQIGAVFRLDDDENRVHRRGAQHRTVIGVGFHFAVFHQRRALRKQRFKFVAQRRDAKT